MAELETAMAGLSARGGRIHAGVHQARKALRRTRAVLALGDAALGPGAVLVDHELRRINRGLSTLRDAHALVMTLDRLAAKPHDEAVARLLRRARRIAATERARHTRESLQAAPSLADRRAMVALLRAALQGLPWNALTPSVLNDALDRTARRIGKAQAQAVASDHDESWHRWRRRMRRLSQQRRACAAIGFDTGAPSLFDKSLAEQLGVAQDLNLLLEHCGRGSPFSKPDRAALQQFARASLTRQRKRVASVGPRRA